MAPDNILNTKLSLKEVIQWTFFLITIVGSVMIFKLTTDASIVDLEGRVSAIEAVKPEKLSWQIDAIYEKFHALKEQQQKQGEILQKIYEATVGRPD